MIWYITNKFVTLFRHILRGVIRTPSVTALYFSFQSLLFRTYKRKQIHTHRTNAVSGKATYVWWLDPYVNAPNLRWTTSEDKMTVLDFTISFLVIKQQHAELKISEGGKVKIGLYEDFPDAVAPGMYGMVVDTKAKKVDEKYQAGVFVFLLLLFIRFYFKTSVL